MLNLEQSITEWRRQMLAAGIKTPELLEELESHLRQDVEHQVQSGVNVQQAFDMAVACMGRTDVLKTEFAKAGGFLRILGGNKSVKTNRILGALWLAGCSLSLNTVFHLRIPSHSTGAWPETTLLLMNMNSVFIYMAGIIGSIFLIRGAKWGRSIVRMLALLMVIVCVAQFLNFGMPAVWRMWCGIVAVFSLVTIWLLHAPGGANSNPNAAAQS